MSLTVTMHTPVYTGVAEEPTYDDKVVALYGILERNQNERDPLSVKLLDAGTNALIEARAHLNAPPAAQEEVVQRHMRKLMSHIVCPLYSTPEEPVPVEDPCIDRQRGIFWDGGTYRKCFAAFQGVWLFDNSRMAENLGPHPMAQEIVMLNGSYRPSQGEGLVVNLDPREMQRQKASFRTLIANAIFRSRQEDCRLAMHGALRDTVQTLEQTQASNNVVLELARAAGAEHPLALRRELEAFIEDYEARLRAGRTELEALDLRHRNAVVAANTRYDAMLQVDATLARELRATIAQTQTAQAAERAVLTTKIATIEEQKRQAEAQRVRDLAQRELENARHGRQVRGLEAQVGSLEANVQAVTLVAAQNEQALLFQRTVSTKLAGELDGAQNEIGCLRRKLRRSNDCAIS